MKYLDSPRLFHRNGFDWCGGATPRGQPQRSSESLRRESKVSGFPMGMNVSTVSHAGEKNIIVPGARQRRSQKLVVK